MSGLPLVSVVVVPREGFTPALACLETLLSTTTDIVWRLVYVDGNAPPSIAKQLRARVRAAGGTFIRANRYLRPTLLRNLGLAEVDTPYVVFLDNDVFVTPGWLSALVACAAETGSAYVSPIICMGNRPRRVVHVAGGENALAEDAHGNRRLVERYDHAHQLLDDVGPTLRRAQTSMAEFHCILIRRSALDAIGGLDERMSAAFEHNDLCLALAGHGGGWLEPAAVVDYLHDPGANRCDTPYHILRWSRGWLDESLEGFRGKYRLPPSDACLRSDLASLHGRRRIPFRRVRKRLAFLPGGLGVAAFDALLDMGVEHLLRRVHERPARISRERW